ncbi:MAG: MFS transporter [Chloroflexota bacterium]
MRPAFTEPPPLARVARSSHYPWLIVGTVCVGAFLGQLDASIAGLVLPTLETEFHAPVASVEWVAISYLLVLAALVVPFGRLSDLAGRKLMYTGGFVLFIIGSALCGMAPGLGWLIAFRAVQAVGAAMLQANSVAIITAAVERRRLGRAIGIQGAAQAVGLSIGPSVGGLLIDGLGWRWVFLIAVPFGLLGTALGWAILPCTTRAAVRAAHRVQERFDWTGALLLGPSVALILVALTFGNTWGWTDPRLLTVVLVAIVCIGAFLGGERRAASPLVDPSLFRSRLFSMGILAGLLSYAVLFGSLFLVPFYLERILGRSAAETGLLLSPIPLALAVMAPIAGALTDRYGSRLPTAVGMTLATIALLTFAVAPLPGLPPTLFLLAVLGIGLGLFTPPNNSAIMSTAPHHRLGTAGGILNMTRSIGTGLGVALTGAILTLALSMQTDQHITSTLDASRPALAASFRYTLLFLAAIAAASTALSAGRGTRTNEPLPVQHTAVAETVGI